MANSGRQIADRLRKHIYVQIVEKPIVQRKREEDRTNRLESDYAIMHEVVDYFYTVVGDICSEERNHIEEKLFDGRTSHNRIGTINFLQEYIGERCSDWTMLAKKKFNINY